MKKEKIFYYVLGNIILLFLMNLLFGIGSYYQYRKMVKEINGYVGGMVEQLKEEYPDIKDGTIARILTADQKDSEILEKLGIHDNNIAILSLEQNKKDGFLLFFLMTLLLDAILIMIFLVIIRKKRKKVEEITSYVKEIHKKNYQLELDKEEEDELSYLKNELYKITVMLKEESEIAKKEKESLKESIEDISHQLKTPLTSIRILLDNLENEEMDASLRKEFLHDISNQLEKMNVLTISLLKLARFDAGVVSLEKKKFSVSSLLQAVSNNLSILLELHQQTLEIKGEENTMMEGDFHWEQEAITNIVKNSIEHAKPNTKITISYTESPFYVTITIEDRGCGISKKDQKHIFDRFYKSKNASSDSIGIGLALSKTIIEKDGGTIRVDSKEGLYTKFQIQYEKK